MSTPYEDIAAGPDAGGYARQKLSSLKARWGVRQPDDGDWKKCEMLMCKWMDYTEIWSRVSGTGDDAWFELRSKVKP